MYEPETSTFVELRKRHKLVNRNLEAQRLELAQLRERELRYKDALRMLAKDAYGAER